MVDSELSGTLKEIKEDVKELRKDTGEFRVGLARLEERVAQHSRLANKVSGVIALVVSGMTIGLAKVAGLLKG